MRMLEYHLKGKSLKLNGRGDRGIGDSGLGVERDKRDGQTAMRTKGICN